MVIQDEDRPYIEFERVINRGIKPRKEKRTEGKDGKVKVRLAHPGATTQIWRKSLIGRMGISAQAPYTWVTPDWVLKQIKPDCHPIAIGNLDKLPPNYPAEWRAQLELAMSAVSSAVSSHKKLKEAEARLADAEKRAAEAEAKANARAAKAEKGANVNQ